MWDVRPAPPPAALLELALDLVAQGLDGVDRARALLAGALEPVHELGALEGLPPAVLLDHHGERLLDPLVGGEAPAAVLAVAPAADRVPFLAEARVHDPVLQVVAERAAHAGGLHQPGAVDGEAPAEVP